MDITTKLRLDHDDGEHMSGPVAGCSACALILSFTRVPTNAYVIANTGKEIWRGSQDQLVALVEESASLRTERDALKEQIVGLTAALALAETSAQRRCRDHGCGVVISSAGKTENLMSVEQ